MVVVDVIAMPEMYQFFKSAVLDAPAPMGQVDEAFCIEPLFADCADPHPGSGFGFDSAGGAVSGAGCFDGFDYSYGDVKPVPRSEVFLVPDFVSGVANFITEWLLFGEEPLSVLDQFAPVVFEHADDIFVQAEGQINKGGGGVEGVDQDNVKGPGIGFHRLLEQSFSAACLAFAG